MAAMLTVGVEGSSLQLGGKAAYAKKRHHKKKHRKNHAKRKHGHRQDLVELRIDSINL